MIDYRLTFLFGKNSKILRKQIANGQEAKKMLPHNRKHNIVIFIKEKSSENKLT